MHQRYSQLFSVAFSLCIALGLPSGVSALPTHKANQAGMAAAKAPNSPILPLSQNDSADSKAQASDPIAMHRQPSEPSTASRSSIRPASQSNDPSSRSVVYGTGVWEAGHAGLALPARGDSRIGEPLVIPGIEQFPENRILIFNSQGQKVFTQRGYANGWSGLDREGQPLPQGRYFVIVEVDGMGDDVQSYLNLVR